MLNTKPDINENQINNDKTFNELKELQKLVKKESAVKELFIRMKNETKNSIERQCVDVYKKKMEVLNILQKIDNSKTKKNQQSPNLLKEHILVENNYEYLSNLNTYISNVIRYLWEEPKLLADLLINAEKGDVKEFLAPLICHNFYENILSPNYIEDPLIYIIYLLLKNEIDSIKDINQDLDKFLNETPCSFLLTQLIEKNDIKEFFKIILKDSLEEIGTDKFIFSIDELNAWQRKRGKTINKSVFDKNYLDSHNVDKTGKRKTLDQTFESENDLTKVKTLSKIDIQGITEDDKETIKNNINYQVFTANYLTSIPLSEIQDNINQNKDNIYLKNYYENLLLSANGDKETYSQTNFFENIISMKDSESLLVFYLENFLKVKEFLNKFLENFLANYRIIPYTIKCVCKIINQLVNKKFKEANEIQKNIFISNFLYKTLIFPILKKPDINALINDYIISNNTLYNMNIITKIFWTLASFKLFKDKEVTAEGNYTPFNRFFLEKIEEIFEINKKVLDVNLPHFIDDLINNNINEDEYQFDYFNENPDEISFYQSILLNIHDFNSLFFNLVKFETKLLETPTQNKTQENKNDQNKPSIYSDLKNRSEKNKRFTLLALKKLKSPDNFKLLTEIINKVDYSITTTEVKSEGLFSKKKIIENKKEIVKYFHFSQILFNEKSKKLFSLEQKPFYYHIKELKEKDFKDINPKELLMKNNIIKCKNFISSILYNYRILEKSDFNKGTTNNVMDILKELTYFMKSSNYLIDGKIPSEWFTLSLMGSLKKLPEEYKINEYEKLFSELTSELNESIKKCNFEYMSLFLDEMKFGNRNKAYYEKVKEIYMDIELNNKAINIIEKENINFGLYYNFTEKKQEFLIYQEGTKERQLDFLESFTFDKFYKGKSFKTIEQFTKMFPNLNKIKLFNLYDKEKINVFEFQKALDIPNKLVQFFNLIKIQLQKKIKNENELNIINGKIYDYVMKRIHDKIYPKEKSILDVNILKKACQLSWIEAENIIKDKTHYDFDFVLPDINNYFSRITSEKSPRMKIINLSNIFTSINRLLKFTKGDVPIGVDDQMPLLIYCFIKSRPWGIFTDCNFMKLYIGNKKNKSEDNELSQLSSICDFIEQSKYNSFINVTESEFNEKGGISINENRDYINQYF